MPLDLPGRRAALRILHESGRLARRGDLARYAVAAVHGRRDRIPAVDAADPTVAAFLLGDYTAAVPLFAAGGRCRRGARPARVGRVLPCRPGPLPGRARRPRRGRGRTRAHAAAGRATVRAGAGLAAPAPPGRRGRPGDGPGRGMAGADGGIRAVDGPRSRPALGQSGHRRHRGPHPGAHGPHRCRPLPCSPVPSTR